MEKAAIEVYLNRIILNRTINRLWNWIFNFFQSNETNIRGQTESDRSRGQFRANSRNRCSIMALLRRCPIDWILNCLEILKRTIVLRRLTLSYTLFSALLLVYRNEEFLSHLWFRLRRERKKKDIRKKLKLYQRKET